jgi:hypothetical protein
VRVHSLTAKDENYKHVGHTTYAPIKMNEKFTIIKFGTNFDNLPTNKMYVINIDETWLYKQPLTMFITPCHVTFIEAPMTL